MQTFESRYSGTVYYPRQEAMVPMFIAAKAAAELFKERNNWDTTKLRAAGISTASYAYESEITAAVRTFFPEYRSYGVGYTERFIVKLMEWNGERYANIATPAGGVEIESFSDVPAPATNSAFGMLHRYSVDMKTKKRVKVPPVNTL